MEENITQKDYYYVKDDHDYDVYNLSENHREEWLRLVAEKQQARKVKGKAGLSTSRSLYFGTRRSTHSDVVSMITTTKPHVDKGYGPTWGGLDNGKIKLYLDNIYGFKDFREAHNRMEESNHIGKIILSLD